MKDLGERKKERKKERKNNENNFKRKKNTNEKVKRLR